MSRSSDIVHQIQQHRAERKKPKINAKLKKVSIDDSQKGGIAAAQENKPPPITVQKTGGRNSLALTFSIGLHVGLALLLGFFYITQQLTSEVEDLEVALVPQELPQRERPINKPPPRPDFDPKLPEIEAPIQQPPVTNPDIPQTEGGLEIPLPSDTDLAPEGPALNEGPKIKPIPGVKGPVQLTPLDTKPTFEKPSQDPPLPDFKNTETSTEGPTIDFPDDIDTSQAGTSYPKPTKAPDPIYPENAKRAGKEGIVKVQATVGTDGIPRNVVALTEIGFGFEEAAVEAMKKWRFIPGKKKGKETKMTVKIKIEFTLDD
ncbi:MAG: TonB family protein [Candidatus Poribacteria bacterium]|nr:TonB family protein [Candidatus Poribacteria bacterium]